MLRLRPHGRLRMTRGRRGSLGLRRRALSSPPPGRFIPAHASSSRTAQARVQVNWSEVPTLVRALQAVTLTASERAGPRAIAPILLPNRTLRRADNKDRSRRAVPELDHAR